MGCLFMVHLDWLNNTIYILTFQLQLISILLIYTSILKYHIYIYNTLLPLIIYHIYSPFQIFLIMTSLIFKSYLVNKILFACFALINSFLTLFTISI